MPTDTVKALQRSMLFRDMSEAHLERLAERAGRRRYAEGETIFEEGQPGTTFFIVASGEVQLRTHAPAETELIVAFERAGDAFGELALLDDEPRSATATAVVDSELLVLHRDDFLALLDSEPGFARSVMRSLAAIIRRTNVKLGDVGLGDVHRRMARNLIDLADHYGRPHPHGVEITKFVSPTELGQLTGLHRVEVERLLRDYEYERLINVEGDHIVIRNPEAMRRWL